ncbi:MAG: Maf family protein [Bifidobacteriaceae bacterium]|jgi:septum formation protein|nr:Maf family protein [Bifidobacteriaceae bacterium]
MENYKVILASKSIGRLKTLKSAGITPYILSPELDESSIIKKYAPNKKLNAKKTVLFLAKAKGEKAVKILNEELANNKIDKMQINNKISNARILLAGDSVFEFRHKVFGKPENYETAKKHLKSISGQTGKLYSAIYIYDLKSKNWRLVANYAKVTMHTLSNKDIENYLSTNEPYLVAGGFTIDGLGGAFVEKINGDPHTVVGMPLAILRLELEKMNIEWFKILDNNFIKK